MKIGEYSMTLNAFLDFYTTMKELITNIVVNIKNFLLSYFPSEVIIVLGIFFAALIIILLFLKFSHRD